MATVGQGRDDEGVLSVTLTAAATIGLAAQLNSGLIGVYQKSGSTGDLVPFKYRGLIYATKHAATGRTWAVGQKLYYMATGTKISDVATGHTLCGNAVEAATATATAGWVLLNP
jgi:predicted RecA/RadA family phage recombinase